MGTLRLPPSAPGRSYLKTWFPACLGLPLQGRPGGCLCRLGCRLFPWETESEALTPPAGLGPMPFVDAWCVSVPALMDEGLETAGLGPV